MKAFTALDSWLSEMWQFLIHRQELNNQYRNHNYINFMNHQNHLKINKESQITSDEGKNPIVTQLPQGLFGIITREGNVIVPFGKYDWIENFHSGISRVKIGKETNGNKNANCKWGIIDAAGNELLPPIYDNLWIHDIGYKRVINLEHDGVKDSIEIVSSAL